MKDMVFVLPNDEKKATSYQVYDSFNENGVVPSVTIPIYPRHTTERDIVHLVFRGTYSAQQLLRDTDFRGIGKSTFDGKSEKIIETVKGALIDLGEGFVDFYISGYSLGGCDTQRALVIILIAIVASSSGSPLRNIKRLIP